MKLPFGILSRDEYNQRIATGVANDDLLKESRMKYLAGQASQSELRKRAGVPSDGNIGAGVTPAGASPVGNNRDAILNRIKDSADVNPYTGYGDRYQAINDLAAAYQDGAPVSGWERVKGLVSSGLDALAAGGNYGGAKIVRWVEDQADALQRKATGGLTTGSPSTSDETLRQLAEDAARKDEAFRSYIYGRKPGTSSGNGRPVKQSEAEPVDEAIRLKDWIFGKRPGK